MLAGISCFPGLGWPAFQATVTMRILITGAAGNLGSCFAQHLLGSGHTLRLLAHKTALPADLASAPNVECCTADLGKSAGLDSVCQDVDCIVQFAGVLFAPRPQTFLSETNVGYVENLLESALNSGVRKFVLLSFPHVEGETTPEHPATDRLQTNSGVVHFRTRLEAEKQLLKRSENRQLVPVIVRAGVVYGRGIKLIEAARRLLRYRLLAVWNEPTWIHLIALPDFLNALQAPTPEVVITSAMISQ
jgi:nucleoside-diphosphate-sugar epimerase